MKAGGSGRSAVIAGIIAIHALLFWSWRYGRPAEVPGGAQREILVTLVRPKPPRLTDDRRQAEPRPVVTRPRQPTVPRTEAVPEPPEPQAITVLPAPAPDPFAEAAPAATERPGYDIAKIDREVRKQSLNPAVRETVLQAPKLERLIGAAKTQRGPTPVEELVMNDGTRVSKVGRMCAQKRPSAMVGGYDAFRNGNETIWKTCPK